MRDIKPLLKGKTAAEAFVIIYKKRPESCANSFNQAIKQVLPNLVPDEKLSCGCTSHNPRNLITVSPKKDFFIITVTCMSDRCHNSMYKLSITDTFVGMVRNNLMLGKNETESISLALMSQTVSLSVPGSEYTLKKPMRVDEIKKLASFKLSATNHEIIADAQKLLA